MSKDAKLDEFSQQGESDERGQEWKEVQLQDVAYKRSDNVDPQEVELEKHVGLEHIHPNDPIPDWETLDDLSSTKRRFEAGDILFAKLRPNLEKSAQPDFGGVASTDIFPIVAESNVNSKWLLYRLSSKAAYDYARRTSAGTRMPRTSWNLFSNFRFDLPSLPEQRKIATVLYTVDRGIEKAEGIGEQAKRVKQAVAQELIHEGVDDSQTKDAWMGRIPSHWEVREFSELVDFSQNGIYKESDDYGGPHPIIKMGDIFGGVTLDEPISERVHLEEAEKDKYATSEGDLVFARHAQAGWGAGDCTYVPDMGETTVVESNMVQVRLNDEVAPMFYAQYFNSEIGVKSIKRITTTGNIKSISQGDLMNLKVPIPPKEEQEEIAETLSVFDEWAEYSDSEVERLRRLKKGLMQDLLSGKVRTTDTNIEVPEEVAQHG